MKRLIFVSAFLLLLLTAAEAQTRVVAHRGYWTVDGCVENTLASLQNAADAKVWGSEFDVWITADGKAVVHHDATVDGLRIETARYKDVKKKRLKNGKRLPTLEEYLKLGRRLKDLRLVLELKPYKERANEDRCVAEVLRLVGKYGVAKQTEYISFSMHICEELVRRVPGVEVAYLGGNVSPKEAKKRGLTGIDYSQNVFAKHPEWIAEAKRLGLVVNVWTVDQPEAMQHFVDEGVDIITTNYPIEAMKIVNGQ